MEKNKNEMNVEEDIEVKSLDPNISVLSKTLEEKLKLKSKLVTNFIVLGMAGSGKTTFVKKLEEEMANREKESYVINMDPAVHDTLYEPNLDIRDTIKYKEVMVANGLGPNGAIMTCLNLFATNIHKIIDLLETKTELEYIVIDTPGQLEVFSWSASGKLISDSFSVMYPTILIYIVDIPRCQNPNTFASNMLYSLSIMYKMKLPLLIVFNKKDVIKEDQVFSWISDYEEFQAALDNDSEYISSFSRSLSLVLEEFYKNVKYTAVSSKTGEGFDTFFKQCDEIISDYLKEKESSS